MDKQLDTRFIELLNGFLPAVFLMMPDVTHITFEVY